MSLHGPHAEPSPDRRDTRRTHADPESYPVYVTTRRFGAAGATLVGLKPTGLDVHFSDEQILHYDLAGRLLRIAEPYCQWRRGLSGRMLEVRRCIAGDERGLKRRQVDPAEADERITRASLRLQEEAGSLIEGLDSREELAGESDAERLVRVLARSAAFDATRAREDVNQFRSLYHDVPVLPPDQYTALVLAATDGCRYNQCTFCGLYRDVRFRRRSASEFRAHVQAAWQYHGASLTWRRTVFLGQADALLGPRAWRDDVLQVVHEFCEFPPPHQPRGGPAWWQGAPTRFTGITSFLDAFAGRRIAAEEFAAMRERHLTQVFFGLESGSESLLRWLRKPSTAAESLEAVRAAKQGGVRVGVIVLVGAGGEPFFEEHVRDTCELIRAMRLEPGDYVYLSPIVAAHGAEYAAIATAEGVAPLTPARLAQQESLLRAGIRQPPGPYVAHYEVEDFVY